MGRGGLSVRRSNDVYARVMDSNKIPFSKSYEVIRNVGRVMRSQFSRFNLLIFSIRPKRCFEEYLIRYGIKMNFSLIAKTIWNLSQPSIVAYGRVWLRETAFYYCPSKLRMCENWYFFCGFGMEGWGWIEAVKLKFKLLVVICTV